MILRAVERKGLVVLFITVSSIAIQVAVNTNREYKAKDQAPPELPKSMLVGEPNQRRWFYHENVSKFRRSKVETSKDQLEAAYTTKHRESLNLTSNLKQEVPGLKSPRSDRKQDYVKTKIRLPKETLPEGPLLSQ